MMRLKFLVPMLLLVIGAEIVAQWLLLRVEHKQLFLLALPIDAHPTSVELADATSTSKAFRIPALMSIAMFVYW